MVATETPAPLVSSPPPAGDGTGQSTSMDTGAEALVRRARGNPRLRGSGPPNRWNGRGGCSPQSLPSEPSSEDPSGLTGAPTLPWPGSSEPRGPHAPLAWAGQRWPHPAGVTQSLVLLPWQPARCLPLNGAVWLRLLAQPCTTEAPPGSWPVGGGSSRGRRLGGHLAQPSAQALTGGHPASQKGSRTSSPGAGWLLCPECRSSAQPAGVGFPAVLQVQEPQAPVRAPGCLVLLGPSGFAPLPDGCFQ